MRSMLAKAMADIVSIVRLGFRQIFRQDIFTSIITGLYLLVLLKFDKVNRLLSRLGLKLSS